MTEKIAFFKAKKSVAVIKKTDISASRVGISTGPDLGLDSSLDSGSGSGSGFSVAGAPTQWGTNAGCGCGASVTMVAISGVTGKQ